MEWDEWNKRARKRARVAWGYEGMFDDAPEYFDRCFDNGDTPEDAADAFGRDYDLIEPDPWTRKMLEEQG